MSGAAAGRRVAVWLGLALGGTFLWLFLRDLDGPAVWAAIRAADPGLLAAALALQLVFYGAKALRWRLLLPDRASLRDLWDAIALGFAANVLLPGRVGELFRMGAIGRFAGVPLGHSVTSLLIERLADVATLAFLLGIGSALLPGVDSPALDAARTLGATLAVAAVLALPVVIWLGRGPDRLRGWLEALVGRLPAGLGPRIEGLGGSLIQGLGVLRGPREWALLTGGSLVHWGLNLGSTWLTARSLGIELGLGPVCLLQGAVAFAVALPQAPGFIGTFQYAAATALVALGTEASLADALALVWWLVGILPPLLTGAVTTMTRGRAALHTAAPTDPPREPAGP